jgi:site-specific recombinase XerD
VKAVPELDDLIPVLLPMKRLTASTDSAVWSISPAVGHHRRARIGKTVTPHTLRHAFITAALDAGVPLRDVQEAASHADPRTTIRYDRARGSLDRHATYIVAAYVAGAAR